MLKEIFLILCLAGALPAAAQDRSFTLSAPEALVETGFLKYLLPRFSLKKNIRINLVQGAAEAALGTTGTPVFRQGDMFWHLSAQDGPLFDAFRDWLLSDVGKRTIEGFAPDGTALFSADVAVKAKVEVTSLTGDAVLGKKVSETKCGRCHVVTESNRMNAIGSTPSFMLMRNFADWEARFLAFFTLNPHPAFTQVENVTEPFAENLPSPIHPIEVTLIEIDAIIAYVADITPADLGAPLRSQ